MLDPALTVSRELVVYISFRLDVWKYHSGNFKLVSVGTVTSQKTANAERLGKLVGRHLPLQHCILGEVLASGMRGLEAGEGSGRAPP